MGQVRSISRSPGQKVGQICIALVYTLGAIFMAQSSLNLVRKLIWLISQSSLNIGQSLGQIIEKPCLCTRGYIFGPIFLKTDHAVNLDDIFVKFECGSGRVKK